MPRKPRMLVEGEAAIYHVISRTALDGFVIGDAEKDYLLQLVRDLSRVYFAEVLAFCLMGNHFHLVVRMFPGAMYSESSLKERFALYYGEERSPSEAHLASLRAKWSSLSEFVKEIKQGFTRYYNRKHQRKGFFWSGRFKSVLVEEGETLINLLAYVDLNPVRAGIVTRPEDYRWCSLGWHMQTGNRGGFLSLDFGLWDHLELDGKQCLARYRQFVYEAGSLKKENCVSIPADVVQHEAEKGFVPTATDRFLSRTRYFTDSGIIGSREFVRTLYQRLGLPDYKPGRNPG